MARFVHRRMTLTVVPVLSVVLLAIAPSATAGTALKGVAPSVVKEFPSADSTVVGSLGFIDDDEVGYFWSVERGDRVTESFSGPPSVRKAVLRVEVVNNALNSGAYVEWEFSINGVVVGTFRVEEGQTGPIRVSSQFAPIPGPTYEVTIRVTNEVPVGQGSHTLAYAGSFAHHIR